MRWDGDTRKLRWLPRGLIADILAGPCRWRNIYRQWRNQ